MIEKENMAAMFADILNQEIARELLMEREPNISEDDFNEIWSKCQGNPWSAPILYELIRKAKEQS